MPIRRRLFEHTRKLLRTAGAALVIATLVPLTSATAQQTAEPLAGKFIWFDLVTDDLSTSQRFYSEVFGWRFGAAGPAPAKFTVIEHAGRPIGGMLMHEHAKGRGARWISLMSVRDSAQAARFVETHRGTVIVPPASVAGRGSHALLRDPQGAVFGVLQSSHRDAGDRPVADGEFFWVDLLTSDPAAAAQFYQGLAGYRTSAEDIGNLKRIVLESNGYARAGIAPLPESVKHPGWLPYVLVDDVAAMARKVVAAGGSLRVVPRDDLFGGHLAVIADPRGAVLGIINWTGPSAVGARR